MDDLKKEVPIVSGAFPFWTLLNVVIVVGKSSSLNNDSFDGLSNLELYRHFNEHILYG